MKRILGLDLGTNSIGWAVVDSMPDANDKEQLTGIEGAGSRIIPMDAALMGDFDKGNSTSQTHDRTMARGARRLNERHHLRRERLLRVLRLMGFLPQHYAASLSRYGKFLNESRLPWRKNEEGQWEFIFKDSYEEMLTEFRQAQPEWLNNGGKIAYDWLIYYLRKKALTEAVTPQELAWILLSFNSKRGYYQRTEDEGSTDKSEEFYRQVVVNVEETDEKRGKNKVYNITFDNGMVFPMQAAVYPDWVGKTKEFIVTTKLDNEGNPKTDKTGKLSQTFRVPGDGDWTLQKKKTEADIKSSEKTVAQYIYEALLANPTQKIKGGLVRVIERKFYKDELIRILNTQRQFIPQLTDRHLYELCINELYPSNDAYRKSIASRDFTYLLAEDIIMYHRPLKSKKHLIDECQYEYHLFTDPQTGETRRSGVKCIAKSHPLFQEFRLWQFVNNLRIKQREKTVNGKLTFDVDVTSEFIHSVDDYVRIFDILNDIEDVDQEKFFAKCFNLKAKKDAQLPYRWNYVEDKTYPCNSTRAQFIKYLKKAKIDKSVLTAQLTEDLWHILYSTDSPDVLRKALETLAGKYNLNNAFVESFAKFPTFKKDYGSYSAKAIGKLLPLMRNGKYWSKNNIDGQTMVRIEHLINGEVDDRISTQTREKIQYTDIDRFRGLPLWEACYVVYGRHSEASDAEKWSSPNDIDGYLQKFRQHSLNNPIVEQVVMETLRTVRDIWKYYGQIDEIHLEMGRNMKSSAKKRAKDTQQINENENRNLRIKAMLKEFINPEFNIEGVRPYSPGQQELFKIYEDYALGNLNKDDKDYEFVKDISHTANPTHKQIEKYKLWLDQKYKSPYTGKVIPLGRLFTTDYEIEHVIPQSRYFDDSLSNKVICESEVNKLKSNMLGLEFIKKHPGEIVELSRGGSVKILDESQYSQLVQNDYKHNTKKQEKLLLEDIPATFSQRQLTDSQYISRFVKALLSNIVREENEQEATSKHLIVVNGTITDMLKKDWGVNDVWNRIILPRFERLNDILPEYRFTTTNSQGHTIPDMPLPLQRGFSKKRIDHRHHAMDAIVIACTTRNHVNLLNNESGSEDNANRRHLSQLLRRYERQVVNGKEYFTPQEFIKPWPSFTTDVENTLRNIIVSFKQNLRVINKTANHYQRFENGKKVTCVQSKGDGWAVRKSLHKDTVFAAVNLQRIKTESLSNVIKHPQDIVNKDLKHKIKALLAERYTGKQIAAYLEENKDIWSDVDTKAIEVYYFTNDSKDRYFAKRESLSASFNEKKILNITDTGIQKILLAHLRQNGNDPELAFSPEGIDRMNQNIRSLNGGKRHQPILKVRLSEKGNKYAIGTTGCNSQKFVEADKGTNLFFAIYEQAVPNKKTGEMELKRSFEAIPLRDAIGRMKEGLPPAPTNEEGIEPKYVLSPGDLVYLPTEDEIKSGIQVQFMDKRRIYKTVSFDKSQCFFVSSTVASSIVDKKEFSPLNKMERAITGEMIKMTCVPIQMDRLGHITLIDGHKP